MQLPTTLAELPVAQWHPGPHGPHWGGGYGMDATGTGFGLGMGGGWWLVLLIALLAVAVAAALFLAASAETDEGDDGALAVLRERYAAGDVDEEEFERRRERLTGGSG